MLFEIPKHLNPKVIPLNQIKKDDSNYGIDTEWTKMVLHVYKGGDLLNLARIIWVKKSSTLLELHKQFFHEFKNVIFGYYKDLETHGKSDKYKGDLNPLPYAHPETGELLTYTML